MFTAANGELAGSLLLGSHNDHVGNLFELGKPNLSSKLFRGKIGGCPDPPCGHFQDYFTRVIGDLFRDGKDAGLLGSKPDGEVSREVLD